MVGTWMAVPSRLSPLLRAIGLDRRVSPDRRRDRVRVQTVQVVVVVGWEWDTWEEEEDI